MGSVLAPGVPHRLTSCAARALESGIEPTCPALSGRLLTTELPGKSDGCFGYSSINALSKALFNLSYISNYNIANLTKSCKIIVQVHIFYNDLINEIINKTNNIPTKFDLYITTTSLILY